MGACISAEQHVTEGIPGACDSCCQVEDTAGTHSYPDPLSAGLLRAINHGHVPCLNAFIAAGASAEGLLWGKVPLHEAVKRRKDRCVSALLAAGADVNKQDCEGQTALDMATAMGDAECERVLRAHGARPSRRARRQRQRQRAAAQPGGRPEPAHGTRQQQPRQAQQQVTQGLGLRAVERRQLQEFCRRQGLYAGGSKPELEERIIGAMAHGRRVFVHNILLDDFLPASVTALRHRRLCEFDVRFDDGSTGVYDLFSAPFYIIEDDGPGSGRLQTSGSFARRDTAGGSAYVWYANEEGRRDAERALSASPSLPRQPQSSGPSAPAAGVGGNAQQEEDNDNMCRVCFDEPRSVAFVPCGHFAACATCAAREEIRRACPYCKQRVTSTIRIYNV